MKEIGNGSGRSATRASAPGAVLSDIEVHDAAELVSFTGDDGREAISVSLAGSVLVR